MSRKELQHEGYRLGRRAFKRGVKAVAVLDVNVMKLIRLHQDHTLLILRAWNRGWHTANARAPY